LSWEKGPGAWFGKEGPDKSLKLVNDGFWPEVAQKNRKKDIGGGRVYKGGGPSITAQEKTHLGWGKEKTRGEEDVKKNPAAGLPQQPKNKPPKV